MARRATIIEKRQAQEEALVLAGAYELARPERKAGTFPLQAFAHAYPALGYDFGLLSAHEAEQLSKRSEAESPLPQGWAQCTAKAQTAELEHQGLRLGLVLFPDPSALEQDQAAVFSALNTTIERMQAETDLVIGLSPWGWAKEQEFLQTQDTSLPLLLGSGPGPALRGQVSNKGQTFWIRPYSRGRGISSIQIPAVEKRAWDNGWELGKDIHSQVIVLGEDVAADPEINELLTSFEH